MRGHTHLWLGTAVGAAVASASHEGIVQMGGSVAVAAFSAILVDIDHPNSLASRLLFPISAIAPGFSEGPYRHGRRWLRQWKVYHRREIHSLGIGLGWALVVGLGAWMLSLDRSFAGLLMTSSMAGWASHLLIDRVNPSGIRWWLWPFRKEPFPPRRRDGGRPPLLMEGSRLETILEWAVSVVSGIVVVALGAPEVVGGIGAAVAAGR